SEPQLEGFFPTDAGKWHALNDTMVSQRRIYDALTKIVPDVPIKQVCLEGYTDEQELVRFKDLYSTYRDQLVARLVAPHIPNSDLAEAQKRQSALFAEGRTLTPKDLELI